MDPVIIIPSRYNSTRFPGKPLAMIGGEPMIQHVYRRAKKVRGISHVIVATEDDRIAAAVSDIGGAVFRIRPDHPTGTDAIAEVAAALTADFIINIQGDLPIFNPRMVEEAIATWAVHRTARIGTVATPIYTRDEWKDPNVVKVVIGENGRALYFSRSPIPFQTRMTMDPPQGLFGYRHIGLYIYTREFLLAFAGWRQGELEQLERLEQLRALERDFDIVVSITEHPTVEVDVPTDIQRAEAVLRQRGGK